MKKYIRPIHPEVKIVDSTRGIVDYIASDETLDSYREIIRASGWKFTNFRKNAPFVDSHDYGCIDRLVGKVIDFRVEGKQLIERVQWAIDVPENQLAQLGWKMTEAGYLKGVSVGFYPSRSASRWDSDKTLWIQQLKDLGLHEEDGVRTIFVEQEQIELSTVIIGANPNALAKAYKADVLNDEDLDFVTDQLSAKASAQADESLSDNAPSQPAPSAAEAADAERAQRQRRAAFILKLRKLIK